MQRKIIHTIKSEDTSIDFPAFWCAIIACVVYSQMNKYFWKRNFLKTISQKDINLFQAVIVCILPIVSKKGIQAGKL